MPKLITARRLEGDTEKAKEYVKVHILFPASLLGLICLVAGSAALAYQFIASTYGWMTFLYSSGLLLIGGTLGWVQTRYHQYLLVEHPGHFAGRMRVFARRGAQRQKREGPEPSLNHPGRALVPWGYVLGVATILGAATLSTIRGQVYYIAAFLLPWAGFFWAKTFFWRRVLTDRKS
jgi:hypothetical protein